jgi:hypothetical protein
METTAQPHLRGSSEACHAGELVKLLAPDLHQRVAERAAQAGAAGQRTQKATQHDNAAMHIASAGLQRDPPPSATYLRKTNAELQRAGARWVGGVTAWGAWLQPRTPQTHTPPHAPTGKCVCA